MKKIFYFMLSALVMLAASCSSGFDFNKEIEKDFTFMVNEYGSSVEYLGTDVELNGNLSDLSKDEVRVERFASYYRLDSALFVITRTLNEDSVVEDLVTDDDFSNVRTFSPYAVPVTFKNVVKRVYASDEVRPESNHLALRWVNGEDTPHYVFGNVTVGILAVNVVNGEIVSIAPEADDEIEFSCEDCEETEACEDCDGAVEE